jgi:pimeloyl-ACP methyl ester carboxylesterase
MNPTLDRREVILSGIRVPYLERESTAPTAKAPLLLLHGLVATAETFTPLIHLLPGDRRILALDVLTSAPIGIGTGFNVSFPGLAALIAEFCSAVGLDKPILIGHSHGGALSLQTAVDFPDLPGGLILIAPAHPFGGYDPRIVGFYLSPIGRVFAACIPHLPDWLQNFGVHRMTGPERKLAPAQLAAYRQALRLPKTIPRVIRLITNWNTDMAALGRALELHSIDVPAMLLWGDQDPAVKIETAPALEKRFTRCRWERFTLPGVGHLPTDEEPARCAALIITWLTWRDTHVLYQTPAGAQLNQQP